MLPALSDQVTRRCASATPQVWVIHVARRLSAFKVKRSSRRASMAFGPGADMVSPGMLDGMVSAYVEDQQSLLSRERSKHIAGSRHPSE